ncbi:MAG: hypothetical protein ACFFCS_09855 [Candidatus Hodarchaeota archaeon]
MEKDDIWIRILFKLLIALLFIPIMFGVTWFSYLFEKILRRALKTRNREDVWRLLSYKGLFGAFELIERKGPRAKRS